MMGFDIIVLNNYPNYRSLQGNPFPFFCIFLCNQNGKRSLAPVYIHPEPMHGFSKFKRRLEAEKILKNLYRTDF